MTKDDKVMYSFKELHTKIDEMEKKGIYPTIVGLDYDATLVNSNPQNVTRLYESNPDKYTGIMGIDKSNITPGNYSKYKEHLLNSTGKPEHFRAALKNTIFLVITNSGGSSHGFDFESFALAPRVLIESTPQKDRPLAFCVAGASPNETRSLTHNLADAIFAELTDPNIASQTPQGIKTQTQRVHADKVVVPGETIEFIITPKTKDEFLEYFKSEHQVLSARCEEYKTGKKEKIPENREDCESLSKEFKIAFATYLHENHIRPTLKISGDHGNMTVTVPVEHLSGGHSAKPLVWYQTFYRLKVYPEGLQNDGIEFPQGRAIPNECFQFRDDELSHCKAVRESTGINSEVAVSYDVVGKALKLTDQLTKEYHQFNTSPPTLRSSLKLLAALETFLVDANPEYLRASGAHDTIMAMREVLDPIYEQTTGRHILEEVYDGSFVQTRSRKYSNLAETGPTELDTPLTPTMLETIERLGNQLPRYTVLIESNLYRFLDDAITINPVPKQREIDMLLHGSSTLQGLCDSKSRSASDMQKELEKLRKSTKEAMKEPDITKRAPKLEKLSEETGKLFLKVEENYRKHHPDIDVDAGLETARKRRAQLSGQVQSQFVQAEALFRLADELGVNFSVMERSHEIERKVGTNTEKRTVTKTEKKSLDVLKSMLEEIGRREQSSLTEQELKTEVLKPVRDEVLVPLSNAVIKEIGPKAYREFCDTIGENKVLTETLYQRANAERKQFQVEKKGKEEERSGESSSRSSSSDDGKSSPESMSKKEGKEESVSHVSRVKASREGEAVGMGRGGSAPSKPLRTRIKEARLPSPPVKPDSNE